MSKLQTWLLFFLVNSPFWVLYFVWWDGLRVAIVLTALAAMWSLWLARKKRKNLWTPKLHDIWMIQFLWCLAAVEANTELFYRHTHPSVSILLVAGILCLTVKGVFNGDKYIVTQK